MFLISPRGLGNRPIPCIQFMFTVLNLLVPSSRGFGSFQFTMNPHETENLYFETKTQQIENIVKTVTTNSLFTVYA